ncbi:MULTISPECIES: glycosyltransferase [unclassified Paenibacillus]|uniref:CgeB family protein n=1 Tax=unclassified Paenibacillus TaxID=185978 RepID=UPI0009304D93|nr:MULTISPECIES: glycosyltransferase [unclassified Paenibacillus]
MARRVVRRVVGRVVKQGRRTAWKEGRAAGYERGYHYGRCEAVRARTVQPEPGNRLELKVLFIPQGFQALDHGIAGGLESRVRELVVGTPERMAELAAEHRPDVMIVLNGLHVFPTDHLEQVDRVRGLGIRTVIWFADDPYFTNYTADIALRYDMVITHEQSCVPFYEQAGCPQVRYLPLAADTGLFRPMPVPPDYRSDICFIGMAFWNRVAFFDRLAPYLQGKRVFIGGGLWERMSNYRMVRRFVRSGWIPVEESVLYYSGAKLVINLHRGPDHETDNRNALRIPAMSVNPRTYEISACGTLQLTDMRQDLPRYYTPGVDLDVFGSPEELIAKIDYYLKHEDIRRTIAFNGLRRTMTEHSFVSRIGQLLGLLGYET